jgi:peroxiredoxin
VTGHENGGAQLLSVLPDSTAAAAGLREHDVILKVAGKVVTSAQDVFTHASEAKPGDKVEVVYARAAAEHTVSVTLEAIPSKGALMRRRFVGRPAPSVAALSALRSERARKGPLTLTGKVTVLEFWASWCPSCPLLSKVLHTWQSGGTTRYKQVIGISAEAPDVARRAAREMQISYPIFLDEKGSVAKAYRVNTLPTLFVVDGKGIVRDAMVGYDANQLPQLGELVERLAVEASTDAAPL